MAPATIWRYRLRGRLVRFCFALPSIWIIETTLQPVWDTIACYIKLIWFLDIYVLMHSENVVQVNAGCGPRSVFQPIRFGISDCLLPKIWEADTQIWCFGGSFQKVNCWNNLHPTFKPQSWKLEPRKGREIKSPEPKHRSSMGFQRLVCWSYHGKREKGREKQKQQNCRNVLQ